MLGHKGIDAIDTFAGEYEGEMVLRVEPMVQPGIDLIPVTGQRPKPCVTGRVQAVACTVIVWQRHRAQKALHETRTIHCRPRRICRKNIDGSKIPGGAGGAYRIARQIHCRIGRIGIAIARSGKKSKDALPCLRCEYRRCHTLMRPFAQSLKEHMEESLVPFDRPVEPRPELVADQRIPWDSEPYRVVMRLEDAAMECIRS